MRQKIYTFIYCLLILNCIHINPVHAQDFTFSQFYEQPLLRNPALAGVFTGDLRISMAHRNQWGSITVPFRTTSLSIEHKIPIGQKNDVITIASQMSQDCAGDLRLNRTQILPAINFHKSLSDDNDTYLSGAFMGGPVFSQFDPTALKLGDQFQNGSFSASNATAQTFNNTGYSYWDLNAGLCFSTSFQNKTKFYLAAGLTHITNPAIKSLTGTATGILKPRVSINMGIHGTSGDNGHIMAFTDVFMQQGNRQILGGFMYGYTVRNYQDSDPDVFYIGSFMRWGDALIPVVRLEFNHLSLGVSYDINVSKLKSVSNWRGGLELTFAYKDFLKIRNSTLDKTKCVSF